MAVVAADMLQFIFAHFDVLQCDCAENDWQGELLWLKWHVWWHDISAQQDQISHEIKQGYETGMLIVSLTLRNTFIHTAERNRDPTFDISPPHNLIITFQQKLAPEGTLTALWWLQVYKCQSDSPSCRHRLHRSFSLACTCAFFRSLMYLGVILCASVPHNTLLMDS